MVGTVPVAETERAEDRITGSKINDLHGATQQYHFLLIKHHYICMIVTGPSSVLRLSVDRRQEHSHQTARHYLMKHFNATWIFIKSKQRLKADQHMAFIFPPMR